MPPRFAYWTIILEGKPTAFRAHEREDLLPTFKQLQTKHPDVVLKWFARGRLWESPEEAHAAQRRSSERRKPDWRPGGEHRDPRARFQIPRAEKRRRFAERMQRDQQQRQAPDTDRQGAPFKRPSAPQGFKSDRRDWRAPSEVQRRREAGRRPDRPESRSQRDGAKGHRSERHNPRPRPTDAGARHEDRRSDRTPRERDQRGPWSDTPKEGAGKEGGGQKGGGAWRPDRRGSKPTGGGGHRGGRGRGSGGGGRGGGRSG